MSTISYTARLPNDAFPIGHAAVNIDVGFTHWHIIAIFTFICTHMSIGLINSIGQKTVEHAYVPIT
jgi:hypothetical protein